MRGEVVHHQHDFLGLRIVDINQFAHEIRPISAGPTLGDFHLALSRKWLAGQENLAPPC